VVSCSEKCKENGFDDGIEYGIVRAYARTRNWGEWEVFREFIQNALDEMHDITGKPPEILPCKDDPEYTLIEDSGRGIAIYHLLVGTSEKKEWQRGKFGEGMKIAMLAAIDQNIGIVIDSLDKIIMPMFIRKEFEGKELEVLCVCYSTSEIKLEGTRVYLYRPGLCEKYRKRIVQGLPRECILYDHRFNLTSDVTKEMHKQVIDKACTNDEGWIYVRDIFVSTIYDALTMSSFYSYNLYNVTLDESRRIPAGSSVARDMEHLWYHIGLKAYKGDEKARALMRDLITKVVGACAYRGYCKDVPNVKPLPFSYEPAETEYDVFSGDEPRKVVRELFESLYGTDVVVIYTDYLKRIADYLGMRYIYCPLPIGLALEHIVGTTEKIKKIADEYTGKEDLINTVDPDIRELVKTLEEFAKKVYHGYLEKVVKIIYVVPKKLPDGKEVVGAGDWDTGVMKINIKDLLKVCTPQDLLLQIIHKPKDCLIHYLTTFAHELTHIVYAYPDGEPKFGAMLTYMLGEALDYVMSNVSETWKVIEKVTELRNRIISKGAVLPIVE
jgi:hypothetical protein